MFLTTKTCIRRQIKMTHLHFTLKKKEIQNLIEKSVQDDVSKRILQTVFNQLMENQRTEYIQATEYERSDKRISQRNGYYERSWTTRVGTLELSVPRTRDGKFSPTLFERYQRNEQALLASMLEMYISGVSTRKVSQIVEELCGNSVSKSFVSDLAKQLDPMVKAWQYRSLSETKYPYIMTDVLYIKVREDTRVVSKSCHIAIGINEQVIREIIGLMIENGESESTWKKFFNYLKDRGLQGTELVISDAHQGLISAIQQSFVGATWQRCQVHFMRNVIQNVPKKNSKPFRESLKAIFRYTDIEIARIAKNELIDKYSHNKRYEKACKILDEGFEDAFQYTIVGQGHSRLKSTNLLERLNQEVRRREKIVRIFPNTDSANRLIGAILIDIHDEWISSSRTYIKL